MTSRQPDNRHLWPRVWLVTDARTDAGLERAIARLPRGSGVIFRHYHLAQEARARRLAQVRRWCRRHGHRLEVAGDGYGASGSLASAHDLREIGRANRRGAEAIVLSPVYPTRSHPRTKPLGRVRFLLLARRARAPVIALGGMTARRFRGLAVQGWAAIDAFGPQS